MYDQIVSLAFTYLCVFEFTDPHDETNGRTASSVGRVRYDGRTNEV